MSERTFTFYSQLRDVIKDTAGMTRSVRQEAYKSLLFSTNARPEETTRRLDDGSVRHPEILSMSTASAGLE